MKALPFAIIMATLVGCHNPEAWKRKWAPLDVRMATSFMIEIENNYASLVEVHQVAEMHCNRFKKKPEYFMGSNDITAFLCIDEIKKPCNRIAGCPERQL